MALSTANLPQRKAGYSKTIKPGNIYARIIDISLTEDTFNTEDHGYYLNLHLEGPELGDDFEGFWIDKDDESKGRHKGQVGKLSTSQWAYKDKEFNGREIKRDIEILQVLADIARNLNKSEELAAVNADTIEEYVDKAKLVLCGEESWLYFCIGGREYIKNSYTNHILFLVKNDYKNHKYSFAADQDNVIKFNPASHIVVAKKKEVQDEFAPAGESATVSAPVEFDMSVQDDLPF